MTVVLAILPSTYLLKGETAEGDAAVINLPDGEHVVRHRVPVARTRNIVHGHARKMLHTDVDHVRVHEE